MYKKLVYIATAVLGMLQIAGLQATFDPRMTRDIVIDIDTTLTTFCAQTDVNFEGTFTTIAYIESLLKAEGCAARFIGQADVGTAGFTITSSGVYKLSQNIIFNPVGSTAAITINADNVLLDLQCFTITQGNTTANVDGIAINANLSSIMIHNGKIKKFTRDGIRVASGVTNVAYANITIQNCLYGIFCLGTNISPTEDMQALELDLLNNSTGISLTFVNRTAISECVFFGNAHAGIELITSFSNNIDSCSIEETGAANGSAFGVSMINGGNNRVQNCYIDGVSTNDTFSGNSAVGILLGATENDDLILNNQISNCTTTSNAQPFGIEMLYTITSTPQITQVTQPSAPNSSAWSPNGRYFAVADTIPTTNFSVYEFAESSLKLIQNVVLTGVRTLSWSPDGSFLAVIGTNVNIYSVNQGIVTLVAQSTPIGGAGSSWSPDGKYLAVANGNLLDIFSFDGVSIVLVASVNLGTTVFFPVWSPDSDFVAINAGTVSGTISIYQFSGNSLQLITSVASSIESPMTWSPDEKFLAIGTLTTVNVYSFSGVALQLVATFNVSSPQGAFWSPDGQYLAVLQENPFTLILLKFIGTALIQQTSQVVSGIGDGFFAGFGWSSLGNVVGFGAFTSSSTNYSARVFAAFQFPSGSLFKNNKISQIHGPAISNGQPGVSSGRGLSASSANNLIYQNTVFDADLSYVFVNNIFEQFISNANQKPSLLSNVSFPPL